MRSATLFPSRSVHADVAAPAMLVELDQSDKPAPSSSDAHMYVVHLAKAPPGWPTGQQIVWSGKYEPRGLLRPVTELLLSLKPLDPGLRDALTEASAGDAVDPPVDLHLLSATSDYSHTPDLIRWAHLKGVGSPVLAVVWPGRESAVWLLENSSETPDTEVDILEYAYPAIMEASWESVPEAERTGAHALRCLSDGLAAGGSRIPRALRAAVERAERDLEQLVGTAEHTEPNRIPSITTPLLRLGSVIAGVEHRLGEVADETHFEQTASSLREALKDVRATRSEARQLVDLAGSVFAARQLELAEQRAQSDAKAAHRDTELQRTAAMLGAVILVPTLVTAALGANVAQPYEGRPLGFVLMATALAGAVLMGLAFVRWRLPTAEHDIDRRAVATRVPVPWLLLAPGGLLAMTAAALATYAALSGQFGSRDTTAPELRRLNQVARETQRNLRTTTRSNARHLNELTEILKRIEARAARSGRTNPP